MNTNLILIDVSDVGAAECKGEHGAYSTESMCVSFRFSREAFISALRHLRSSGVLSEELKTVVHETTHHLHTVTTPFGIFVHTLRVLQSGMVYDIAGLIREAGLPLRTPIVGHLDVLPKSILPKIEALLKIWYTAELFVLRTFGETERWRRHYERNPYIIRTDFGSQLKILDAATTIETHFESLRRGDSVTIVDIDIPEASPTDWGFDQVQYAAELMAETPINLMGILESAATVAEMWGSNMALGEFRQTVEEWRSSALGTVMAPYRWPIRYAIEAIGAANLQQFVMSYLALCEAALFSPALPELRSMRHDGQAKDLIPILRWLELVSVARSVKPIEDITDYSRYSDELCSHAGWATLQELSKVRIENFPRDPDPRRTLYRDSQKLRKIRPSFFIEYPELLLGPLSRKWALPVMQYEDGVLFHVDKDFLERVRETHIARTLSRRLLVRSDLCVPCPYRASAEHRQELTATAKAALEPSLGTLEGFAII